MKSFLLAPVFFLSAVIAGTFALAQTNQYPFQNPAMALEERVDNIVSLMTLDEKIAFFSSRPGQCSAPRKLPRQPPDEWPPCPKSPPCRWPAEKSWWEPDCAGPSCWGRRAPDREVPPPAPSRGCPDAAH